MTAVSIKKLIRVTFNQMMIKMFFRRNFFFNKSIAFLNLKKTLGKKNCDTISGC